MDLLLTASHDHVFLGARHDEHARRTRWVVVLTALMMVLEIAAGYLTGSMALLADGFHMATHAGALSVAAAAYAMPNATRVIRRSASAPARLAISPASHRHVCSG